MSGKNSFLKSLCFGVIGICLAGGVEPFSHCAHADPITLQIEGASSTTNNMDVGGNLLVNGQIVAGSGDHTLTNAAGLIDGAKIQGGTITATQLGSETVTTDTIGAGAVGTGKIATGAVGTAEVADNTLTSSDLGTDSVGSDEIAAWAVGTSEVIDNSLTANDLAADSVGSSEIASGAVGTSEVADNTLTAADLAANAVTVSEIASSAVTTMKIVNGDSHRLFAFGESKFYSTLMARIARIVIPGAAHHVTQRENNKQDVFFAEDDKRVYLTLLHEQG